MAALTGAATDDVIPCRDEDLAITNAPGPDAYPISSFTWLLVPIKSDDPAKGKVIHDFIEWMLDHGESEATGMTYAPLPKNVADKVRGALNYIH